MTSKQNDPEIESLLAQTSFLPYSRRFPEKRLFTCPNETDNPPFLTGKTLEDKIKICGGFLEQKLQAREKALLLLPQGLEYIYGLLACFYANVVAIPTPITSPEQQEQISAKITPILKNSEAACIITDTYFCNYLQTIRFDSVPVFNIDEVEETAHSASANWEERDHTPQDIAMLLYTSGSTSQPKGVMISYRNLFSQALTGARQWDMTEASRIVSWMPQFHNFGLFFNILAPLVSGASSVILAPNDFLKNPENWLATIHKFQATHTAAPNFAFDYCYSSINTDAFPTEFSLSSLQAIVCGGEPVRKETYENFTGKFQCRGLDPNAFCPHFGLSEVGSVTTKRPGEPVRFLSLDIPSLELGKIKFSNRKTKSKSVTSCGVIAAGTEVLIVDPETGANCSSEEIGEILVKSASVAMGYYHQEEESAKTFSGGFLHTGDLGFIDDNHLYVVGREKEVIIIHGKNHHPVDIEWTIKNRIPNLSLPLTVFAVEINNAEKVIVVQELETSMSEPEYKKLCREILDAVSENHELEIYEINLVKKGSVPRTGSGKIQRKNCRNVYLKKELSLLYQHRQGTFTTQSRHDESASKKSQEIVGILKREVFGPLLGVDLSNSETVTSFSELGLDSIQYVRISRQIEAVFKIQFMPVMLFKHRSFENLAEYLATQVIQPLISTEPPEDTQALISTEVTQTSIVTGRASQTNSGVDVGRSQSMKKEIAIIGVSCHFPGGANDLDTFWENLAGQKDGITTITESRPQVISDDQDYYLDSNNPFPEWGGFIEDFDTFDASFFNISPLEAESMDPQQRKILELTWNVIEDSGYNPERLAGTNTGMFIGVHNNDYAELIARQPALMDIYGANLDSGLHMSMIAHRASRWFDFHGPSEILNTACSSSFVALHHAVESIQNGESNLAIAGGINLILTSRVYRVSHDAGMLSKVGRCKTFDREADGFVRAEGYGAVFLKPLEQAIKDGDKIYGVIKKVVINHDGKSNSLRAPNLNAQKELIKAAYQDPDLPPESISFVEVHGTGTSLGDPIEFQALKEAFQEINPDLPEGYCGLGTVKTNIGHGESASGIAGLIKVLLAFKHRTLPGLLHFKQLNPYIELIKSPFYILTQTQEWQRLKNSLGQEIPNRAGISSFGFGGANVHVVVEEYLPLDATSHDAHACGIVTLRNAPVILPISAKNKECLQARVQQLRKFLLKSAAEESDQKAHPERIELAELAFVLQTGRSALEERIAFIVKDIPELVRGLAAYETGEESIQYCWHGHIKQNKDFFENDDDVQALIHNWIAKRKFDKIAQFWVQGGTLNWDLLYTKDKPGRVNLPTYPFVQKRYWVPVGNGGAVEAHGRAPLRASYQSRLHELLYLPVWEEQPIPVPVNLDKPKTVLIVYSGQSAKFEKTIQDYVRKSEVAETVVQIELSHLTKPVTEKKWLCNTDDPDGFAACLKGFDSLDCLFFIADFRIENPPFDLNLLVDSQRNNEIQLLRLMKVLGQKIPSSQTVDCYFLTQDNYRIADTQLNPYGGGITGLAYAIAQGDHRFSVRNIDIAAEDLASPSHREALCKLIFALDPSPRGEVVKLQSGRSYRQAFLKLTPDKNKIGTGLRKGGVYVILGGSGIVGEVITRHLIKAYQAKVVWIGRKSGNTDAVRQKLETLSEFGEPPLYIQADVTDLEQMKQAAAMIKSQYSTINGAIFSGVVFPFDNSVKITTENQFLDIFNVKSKGSINFYTVFQDYSLDFMCYFSSAQAFSFSGAANLSAYAAGITFSDTFIRFIRERSRFPVGLINWGFWRASEAALARNTPSGNIAFLEDNEGIECFEQFVRLLETGALHQVVCLNICEPLRELMNLKKDGIVPSNPTSGRPILKVSPPALIEASPESLEEWVRNMVLDQLAKSLRVSRESIDNDVAFSDYGVDSIISVSFVKKVNDGLGVSLNTAVIFDYTTVNRLTDYIIKKYREQIQKQIGLSTINSSPSKTVKSIDSLFTVNESYSELSSKKDDQTTPTAMIRTKSDIAVIGMSGQFPDAPDINTFWQNLMQGHDAIHDLPAHYGDQSQNMSSNNKMNLRGGVLTGRDCFDPLFFNISPREAESMNPHQRLILQESWKALEDAGYNPRKFALSQAGIFIGAEPTGYFYESFTGASDAIIASRLSYYLDLKGPALVVNTGCSSSGTAIHLACESLRNGESVVTIAGGVYANLSQSSLIQLADIGMLSPTGRCCAFDETSDGTVISEGIGIVVLKRLGDAISDGDHIYGVIRGTGINQDGASNGITAPNGTAQEQLITSVYKQFGVNPEEITYIEAHGTGTKLGDPVELNALVRAYKQFTNKAHYCTVGCAKPFIGHTAAASGVVGLIKILLSMQNHQIPGLINFRKLNPLIELEGSAFYVNTSPVEWRSKNDKPLMAALNNFGHSGTNVHIVIQEYISPKVTFSNQIRPNEGPVLIPISAKNKEQLKEYVSGLLEYLKDSERAPINPVALAYTLQIGREVMEERVIFHINDVSELISKLEAFLADTEDIAGCFRGQVKQGKNTVRLFTMDEDMQETVEKWIYKGKLRKIAEIWAQGLEFDWNRLYKANKPPRMSLPTYPFARERYWVPKSARTPVETHGRASLQAGPIHPLLHQNTSDLSEQRYSSTFTGLEFFLKDHIVLGQRILPGVAYLEMARAAVEAAATGCLANGRMIIKLKNVVWVRPIGVDEEPVQVHLGLYPEDSFSVSGSVGSAFNKGAIAYEVYSLADANEAEALRVGARTVYSQGSAVLAEVPKLPVLDLKALQAECNLGTLSGAEIYNIFKTMGLDYGPGFQGIETVYVGRQLVLAKLTLPSLVAGSEEEFVLHPSIMDAALQASIGFEASSETLGLSECKTIKPIMPFALQELEVLGNTTSNMWALIKESEDSRSKDKVQNLDIDLCDEQGQVCVRLKGFTARVLEGDIKTSNKPLVVPVEVTRARGEALTGTVKLIPAWETVLIKRTENFPALAYRLVVVGGTKGLHQRIRKEYPSANILNLQSSDSIDEITQKLAEYGTIDHILWIAPHHKLLSLTDEALIKGQDQGVLQVFRIIKALLKLGYGAKELAWSLITNRTQAVHKNDEVNPTHASVHGLVGSMAKEYPNWKIRLLDLETEVWPTFSDIFTLPADPAGNALAFRGGEWWRQQLIPVKSILAKETNYKPFGVYVVIGGAGGIGEAWSEYVIRTYQAQVIWIGRREKDEGIQAKIDRLAALGPEPQYIAADATKREALEKAYQEIKQRYSKINGVIHSAIVLIDKSLMNMTEEQFQAGLSAKVDVSVRMAQVFKEESLDFVMFFSALQSFAKMAGQSNYASGCTFKDAFGGQLNLEWPCAVKIMNWGYWGNIGIVASKSYRERMAQAGLGSIEAPEAMEALEGLLAGPMDQIVLVKTTKPLTMEGLNPEKQITIYPESLPSVIGNLEIKCEVNGK